jgi:hypothetical protein
MQSKKSKRSHDRPRSHQNKIFGKIDTPATHTFVTTL